MAKAPGKIILFGEHFVVHGSYAISAALNERFLEVEIVDDNLLIVGRDSLVIDAEANDERQTTNDKQSITTSKYEVLAKYNDQDVRIGGRLHTAAINMLKSLSLNKSMKLKITSNLEGSGLGSSAAFCVAFARTLNNKFNLGYDEETFEGKNKINELAYVGEKAFHGNASGIDNTTSCFGGILLFNKRMLKKSDDCSINGKLLNYNQIKPKTKLKLIIVNTGKKSNTAELVGKVKEFKEKDPEKFKQYIAEINHLIDDAKDAMLTGDIRYFGELMLINHVLLEQIGVSNEEIKKIITVGINNGALGGKLTGAGGGGNVILLYDHEESKEKIINELNKLGYRSFNISL